MKIHVVTPSFNQVGFLKKLVASVSDQATEQVRVHHHVQDGGSTDGSVEWLERYAQEVGGQRTEDRGQRTEDGELRTENGSPSVQNPEPSTYTFSFSSEKDEGMYDAINKGWLRGIKQEKTENDFRLVELYSSERGRRADVGGPMTEGRIGPWPEGVSSSGQHPTSSAQCPVTPQYPAPSAQCPDDGETILAHMNCDEQYLPGALEKIADFFSKHRNCDVVMADMIVVNNEGNYICHRRSLKPSRLLSRICCVGMTTATFQRASVVREKQILFDTSWRNIGDMVWYNALHAAGVKFRVCNELVSLFVDTGDNLNLTEEAVRERRRYAKEYLFGMRRISRFVSKFYSLRRYLKEFYLKPPSTYALYWDDLTKRDVRSVEKPTGLWHRKGPSLQSSAGKE